ncbi:MAG TPA: MFS transporter [Pseudonocardiaceae bacterium]
MTTAPVTTGRALGRRFWALFTANAVTNLGDGIGRICFPLLAVSLTREPVLIAGVSAVFFLPWLLFGLASGVLLDRVDRRRAMIAANLVRAVLVGGFGLAVAGGAASVWLLYVVAFLLGAAETVADGAANAILPAVVRRDQLESGNGRLQTAEVVGNMFLGAPIGAALFAVAAAAPFLLNSAGFLVAALVVAGIAGRFGTAAGRGRSTIRQDVREGVGWIVRHRLLRSVLVLSTGMAIAAEMAQALMVLFAVDELGLGPAQFGLLVLAAGAGGVLGGLFAPVLARRLSRVVLLPATSIAGGLCYLGLGVFPHPVVAAVLVAVFGGVVVVGNVVIMSLRQSLIPPELFGRVQGAWRSVLWGSMPVGGLVGGLLAGVVDLRWLFVIAAFLLLTVGAGMFLTVRRHAPDTPDREPDRVDTEIEQVFD